MSAQEVRGSLGHETGYRKLVDQGESTGAVGGGRHRRGHFCAAGGVRRRRGPESCPRTRRVSPSGTVRTRPREMSPSARGGRLDGAGRSAGGEGGVKRWVHHSWEEGLCLGRVVTGVRVLMWWLVSRIRLSLRCRGVGRLFLLD